VFLCECKHNALGIDSTQYYVVSAALAVLMLQVSVLVFYISRIGANSNFEIQPLGGTCGVIFWNGWFLAMTLALAGPGSLLLTSLSILYLLQCFLLIAGKEQSILIAAASQSNGPLAFGGLLADNTVLCSS
jgi:hypothetical protein